MKKFNFLYVLLSSLGLLAANSQLAAADFQNNQANKQVKIGVVDFKAAIEKSKLGKQEQQNFENLKKQMENVLEEKEKGLNELASKLNDVDYLDSITPEAETELKRKFRSINQELSQQQSQYYQALNQANVKIIQKIQESIGSASERVGKDLGLDVILNNEGTFYFSDALNITDKVVAALDTTFDNEQKNGTKNTPADMSGALPSKGTSTK